MELNLHIKTSNNNTQHNTDTIQYDTLPWIEKYRPKNLDEIISHDKIISVLKNFIRTKSLPHLLFHGPSGTGKTSTIMACARELYGKKYNLMILELNASDDRGIEVVRSRIKKFVMTRGIFFNFENPGKKMFKLVILDEIDAMTDDAQAILRQIMEKYTDNARFCLIGNYLNKINPALRSRCTSFRFSPLQSREILKNIGHIIKKETIQISDSALKLILKRSNGDMRKILNILQTTNMSYNKINKNIINKCIGFPTLDQINIIHDILLTHDYNKAFQKINSIIRTFGLSLNDIITITHEIIINNLLKINNNLSFNTLNEKQLIGVLSKLKDVEHNQLTLSSNNIQLCVFIGVFKLAMLQK
jgi:replication factor C subunit 3/5